jgi:hypothetical protein
MNSVFIYIWLCGFALITFFSVNVLAIEPEHESAPVICYEADEELEQNVKSSLKTALAEFTAKGGTLLRLDKGAAPYQLICSDVVFPSCSGGNNRSQTLWNVLRTYADKIALMRPHATRYGFDPYNGLSNWHRTLHVQKNDEFILWAGVSKSPKFGWDVFESWLSKAEGTPDELALMMDYYNHHYYNPDIPSGTRRIYMTFAKNAHIHLYRLNQTNESLENVVVLFFPLEDLIKDPLPEWNTYPNSAKTYAELAHILESYLDFSQLNP